MSRHIMPAGAAGACCCFTVLSTSEVGVVESFGKFARFEEVMSSSNLRCESLPV
jgi:hypothetical protein